MKRTRFTRVLAFCLAVLMLCGAFGMSASAASGVPGEDTSADALAALLNASSYSAYSQKYANVGRGTGEVLIDAKDVYTYTVDDVVYYYDSATGGYY